MALSSSGSEPGRASDAQRAAWLDECLALSALCQDLALVGRRAAATDVDSEANDGATVPPPRR